MTRESNRVYQFSHSKNTFYGILIFWFIINLLQSLFTELIHDEAYYSFYASKLAWGYYDHPPMVALLIKVGTFIIPNELGARLFFCLMSVGTIAIMAKLAEVKNYLLYFAVIFSIFIMHIGGFIAVPDTPLIFFTALFLYVFKNYLVRDSWVDVLLVSISIAGLLYSKYLGVLVVLFTFMVNLHLVKRKTLWAILLLSSLVMLPHLIWQINNDFITFYFHLTERSRDASFDFMNIVNFLLGQLAILNPMIGGIIFYSAFKVYAKNEMTKTYQATSFGVLAIGLFLAFFSHVEANWTATAFIPLIILAYPLIEEAPKLKKPTYIISIISLVIVIGLRIYLVYDFIPKRDRQLSLQGEIHGWDEWAKQVNELAGDRPVIFANSYQKASKYIYYSDQQAFTFNCLHYRKNQYDLDNYEYELFDKAVLMMYEGRRIHVTGLPKYNIPDADTINIMGTKWYYSSIENYRSYNFLQVEIPFVTSEMKASTVNELSVEIINPLPEPLALKQNMGDTYLCVAFTKNGKVHAYEEVLDISNLTIEKSFKITISFTAPDIPDEYNFRVVIRSGWFPPGLNSRIHIVNVVSG